MAQKRRVSRLCFSLISKPLAMLTSNYRRLLDGSTYLSDGYILVLHLFLSLNVLLWPLGSSQQPVKGCGEPFNTPGDCLASRTFRQTFLGERLHTRLRSI